MPSSCGNRNSYASVAKQQPDAGPSSVSSCPSRPNWDQDCVKKILCANLSANATINADIAGIEVYKVDNLVGVTVEYDGAHWQETKTPIQGAGGIIGGRKIIYLDSKQSCESAAASLFHEYQHILGRNEMQAYGLTEEWGMQQQPRLTQGNQALLDGGRPNVCDSLIMDNQPTTISVERIKQHIGGQLYAIRDAETVYAHYDKPAGGTDAGATESWSKVRIAGKETERESQKGDRHPDRIDYPGTEILQDPSKWKCP